ncbi:hypothetical protein MSG28_010819 [Choristoneura fumiferana]|uniref:Uncharacterized protein n=1 Tax=Choristoneura fumiferana TaxID=7141 RepID=A0ACC0KPK4_CHOFU|nr:hypothetical protein MSG28_010819 [Choristoneura fumiferana]
MSLTEGYCDIIAAAEPRHHPGQHERYVAVGSFGRIVLSLDIRTIPLIGWQCQRLKAIYRKRLSSSLRGMSLDADAGADSDWRRRRQASAPATRQCFPVLMALAAPHAALNISRDKNQISMLNRTEKATNYDKINEASGVSGRLTARRPKDHT